MCVSVGTERVMCRIDPAILGAGLKRKGCRTVVMQRNQLAEKATVREV